MKIAITGSNGLLGQHLVSLLLQQNHTVIAMGIGSDRSFFSSDINYQYYDADITRREIVAGIIAANVPDVLVHAAAITQVDECELNPGKCSLVNVDATSFMLEVAENICRHFIYISTDFVFDGVKGDYNENDETNPVSHYGNTKLAAEALVKNASMPWAIVRTCLVYGNALTGTRSNIVSWVKENLQQGKKIRVVTDQYRTPTHVTDLAKGISLIIDKKATGVFHISGKDKLTPYQMAIATAKHFGLDASLIEKADASSFTQPARRPPRTGFDISKARKELGYEPMSFEEGLQI
jgi:dTDP-4-dehydrorhamnose reductase